MILIMLKKKKLYFDGAGKEESLEEVSRRSPLLWTGEVEYSIVRW